MKKLIVASSLMVFLCATTVAIAAQHNVQSSDTIGMVAQDVGCTIEQLALLNDITAPDYIIRAGKVLKYVDASDIRDARQWIEDRLSAVSMRDNERDAFEKMLQDIDAREISYGSKYSTDASEVLVLAEAHRARK